MKMFARCGMEKGSLEVHKSGIDKKYWDADNRSRGMGWARIRILLLEFELQIGN